MDAPSITITDPLPIKENQNISMKCKAKGSELILKNISYTWYFNSDVILTRNENLVLDNIQRNMSGTYTCQTDSTKYSMMTSADYNLIVQCMNNVLVFSHSLPEAYNLLEA